MEFELGLTPDLACRCFDGLVYGWESCRLYSFAGCDLRNLMPPAQNIFLVIDFSIRSNDIGPDDLEDAALACFQVRNHF